MNLKKFKEIEPFTYILHKGIRVLRVPGGWVVEGAFVPETDEDKYTYSVAYNQPKDEIIAQLVENVEVKKKILDDLEKKFKLRYPNGRKSYPIDNLLVDLVFVLNHLNEEV